MPSRLTGDEADISGWGGRIGRQPAPRIIFATFVGFVAGGFAGALAITAGVFGPAFAFTLVGHRQLERLVENRSLHALLDGVTAGVVGLIAATALSLLPVAVRSSYGAAIYAVALASLPGAFREHRRRGDSCFGDRWCRAAIGLRIRALILKAGSVRARSIWRS